MNRMTWTAIGAAGLMAGTTIGGFALVTAAADRAVRPIELRDVVNPATGEPRSQLGDGSVDSSTGLPKPIVTIAPAPAAMPTDSLDSAVNSSAEVVSKPVVKEAAKPKATAKPKPSVARPAAADSADSSASVASVDSADSADSSD